MAKSKSGGTRSYIRGRVGADVYSIGKDAKGAKQQVVRSLAETVSNPQTVAQMRGRMIMSTVMQAVSGMKEIIDHSFDNVPAGQPSISEFISRNYALIKADVAAHPASGNSFALNEYLEKGVKAGAYIISKGDVALPTALTIADGDVLEVDMSVIGATVGALKTALGVTSDDYITICNISRSHGFSFLRLQINPDLADNTAITAENASTVFIQSGNETGTVSFQADSIRVVPSGGTTNQGVILSKKTDAGFKHSTCVLNTPSTPGDAADEVLPSYPAGTAMFLNGGEL